LSNQPPPFQLLLPSSCWYLFNKHIFVFLPPYFHHHIPSFTDNQPLFHIPFYTHTHLTKNFCTFTCLLCISRAYKKGHQNSSTLLLENILSGLFPTFFRTNCPGITTNNPSMIRFQFTSAVVISNHFLSNPSNCFFINQYSAKNQLIILFKLYSYTNSDKHYYCLHNSQYLSVTYGSYFFCLSLLFWNLTRIIVLSS